MQSADFSHRVLSPTPSCSETAIPRQQIASRKTPSVPREFAFSHAQRGGKVEVLDGSAYQCIWDSRPARKIAVPCVETCERNSGCPDNECSGRDDGGRAKNSTRQQGWLLEPTCWRGHLWTTTMTTKRF